MIRFKERRVPLTSAVWMTTESIMKIKKSNYYEIIFHRKILKTINRLPLYNITPIQHRFRATFWIHNLRPTSAINFVFCVFYTEITNIEVEHD